MTTNQDIFAEIHFTGNIYGLKPSALMRPDTFNFSISEGEKDFGIPFTYDNNIKKFVIKKDQLNLIPGERYKFRGAGTSKGQEPIVTIPDAIKVDTILVKNVNKSVVNGKQVTQIECTMKFFKPKDNRIYFYVVPFNENKNEYEVELFNKDQSAFKRMKHIPGFLVDYSRLQDDEISAIIKVTDDKVSDIADFNVYNTTNSFYEFNAYMSNNFDNPDFQSPPIAGFNIKTEKAFGTFSSKSLSSYRVKIK